MLESTLDTGMAEAWDWDRHFNDNPDGDMWPQREMKELLDKSHKVVAKPKSKCTIL
jgi:hypothetical protein